MLFSNLLFAVALTTVWPAGMLGLLAFCAWLERRTLVAEEVIPRRLRRMASKPPEEVEAMVLEEAHEVIADYWSTPMRPYLGTAPSSNGQRPAAAEPPAAEEPAPRVAVWPRDAAAEPGPAEASAAEARQEQAPPAGPEPASPTEMPSPPRVVPGRVARLARRRPVKGRHERR